MYCRFCGKQIEDDSVFCAYCGKNVSLNNDDNKNKNLYNSQEEKNENDESIEEKENTSSLKGFFILFIPFVIIIAIFLAIASANPKGNGIFTRNIKQDDYSCTTSQGLTSYSITITPNKYFINCDVELELYNSSGKIIFSDTITKTNLKKNSSYTYTFNFNISSTLTGDSIKFTVTGNCKII